MKQAFLVLLCISRDFLGGFGLAENNLVFAGLILTSATDSFFIFQKEIEKLKSKIQPDDRYNICSQRNR